MVTGFVIRQYFLFIIMSSFGFRLFRLFFCQLCLVLALVSMALLDAEGVVRPESATLSLQVSKGNGEGYRIKVFALRKAGNILIDVESFARALRLGFRQSNGFLVIDEAETLSGSSCQLRDGNNFVSIVSKDPRQEPGTMQLQATPVQIASKLYLPVSQACRFFSLWLQREVRYDPATGLISAILWGERPAYSLKKFSSSIQDEPEPVGSNGKRAASSEALTVISGVSVENRENGALISFSAVGNSVRTLLMKPDKNGIAYLTFQNATGNVDEMTKSFGVGIVQAVKAKRFQKGGFQVALSMDNRSYRINSMEVKRDDINNRYLVYVAGEPDTGGGGMREKESQISRVIERDIEKWKFDTVVLDAGHGGKDPGAIGGHGTMEKDVVLNIVRDLGSIIARQWPDIKVVYTRNSDVFIPLHERGKIANRSGGKLFVSIHCNANSKSHIRGQEVYILGPHRTQKSLEVAMFENSVITREADYRERYKGFSTEYLIMSSMAQNAFAKQSTTLAQDVLKRIERKGGTTSRGVHQAGFMVLWTPSMPSILIETGYLSNPEEERILRERKEQIRIAEAVFQGLDRYRRNNETARLSAVER
ncbi:N-acetylmuramoyl-L-alanine amidase [Chlorobium phaeobacteroides DSM 266]|uniref:N-acetylmuramoyl-L-alanine amidase n=2 Tax=Chlorobium phaeobacteroides TaxID=1096 RepID=A1BCQ3_CHLPD|nr:N-acetylmuramoyl-L-alanine amidase [Chlorobium phaeobacteroides DSM 266]